MLLSDELIAIGRESNKKNNLSMADAKVRMLKRTELAIRMKALPKQVENSLDLAYKTLTAEGYTFFGK